MFRPMGYRRFDTLMDIAKQGYWVRLRCACGHEATMDPLALLARMKQRRKIVVQLHMLLEVMRCQCGGKDFTAEHCQGPAIWSDRSSGEV